MPAPVASGWSGRRGSWIQWIARDEQIPPPGDWRTWLYLAGRGAGKTRSGAEWIHEQVGAGRRRIALVAPTAADVRDVMVEGESGILAIGSDRLQKRSARSARCSAVPRSNYRGGRVAGSNGSPGTSKSLHRVIGELGSISPAAVPGRPAAEPNGSTSRSEPGGAESRWSPRRQPMCAMSWSKERAASWRSARTDCKRDRPDRRGARP